MKKLLLFLVVIMAGCSAPPQQPITTLTNEAITQEVTATNTPVSQLPAEQQSLTNGGDQAQVDQTTGEEWHLVASFQYLASANPTDILYTWEAWFTVEPGGALKEIDTLGSAEGQAGLNYDGECIEAQPVQMDWTYALSGRTGELDLATVEEIHGDYEGMTINGKVEMFTFNFSRPNVYEYEISPFACAPDLDPEFVRNLGTFWVTLVPLLESEYRTIPAEPGLYCTPILSFEDEGLGKLVPCYFLEKTSG